MTLSMNHITEMIEQLRGQQSIAIDIDPEQIDMYRSMLELARSSMHDIYRGIPVQHISNEFRDVAQHQQPHVLRGNLIPEIGKHMNRMPRMIRASMSLNNMSYDNVSGTFRPDHIFFCNSYIEDFKVKDTDSTYADPQDYMTKIVMCSFNPDLILDAVNRSPRSFFNISNLELEVRDNIAVIKFGKDTSVSRADKCRCQLCMTRDHAERFIVTSPGRYSYSLSQSHDQDDPTTINFIQVQV